MNEEQKEQIEDLIDETVLAGIQEDITNFDDEETIEAIKLTIELLKEKVASLE